MGHWAAVRESVPSDTIVYPSDSDHPAYPHSQIRNWQSSVGTKDPLLQEWIHNVEKRSLCHMQAVKDQMHIRAVWAGHFLFVNIYYDILVNIYYDIHWLLKGRRGGPGLGKTGKIAGLDRN